jgi:hypothetical protein
MKHTKYFASIFYLTASRGSAVSTVSGYGLDDRAIEVRFPAAAKDFSSSLCVQTGSGAHPVSCKMGTGGPFPGVNSGRGVTQTTHPHLLPRSWMSRSYISPLLLCLHGMLWDCFKNSTLQSWQWRERNNEYEGKRDYPENVRSNAPCYM